MEAEEKSESEAGGEDLEQSTTKPAIEKLASRGSYFHELPCAIHTPWWKALTIKRRPVRSVGTSRAS